MGGRDRFRPFFPLSAHLRCSRSAEHEVCQLLMGTHKYHGCPRVMIDWIAQIASIYHAKYPPWYSPRPTRRSVGLYFAARGMLNDSRPFQTRSAFAPTTEWHSGPTGKGFNDDINIVREEGERRGIGCRKKFFVRSLRDPKGTIVLGDKQQWYTCQPPCGEEQKAS